MRIREACEAVRSNLLTLRKLRIPAMFSGLRPHGVAFGAWLLLFGIMGLIDPAILPIETKLDRQAGCQQSGDCGARGRASHASEQREGLPIFLAGDPIR